MGLFVVSGPTGSGKATFTYAALKEVSGKEIKVVSIENPVWEILDGVCQVQVNPRTGLTCSNALREIMRQDPDVILVSETRDQETAELVVETALTGHLLLTTLHADTSTIALRRLLDMGLEPYLLNNSIIGINAQKLVRLICVNCKEEYEPDDWEREAVKHIEGMKFFSGRGCEHCSNYGYRGRIAINELLELDSELRDLVMKDAPEEQIREQALKAGMISMRQDGLMKAKEGLTTVKEVIRVCPGLTH